MKAFPTARSAMPPEPIKRKPVFGKTYDPVSWHRRCMRWHERRCWAHQGEEFKYHYLAYHWHAKRYQSLTA